MGWASTPDERKRQTELADKQSRHHALMMDSRRRKISVRLANSLIDAINHRVIRPGPMNEERECYDMAEELRAMKSEIVSLIAATIEVDETGQWQVHGDASVDKN